MADLISAQLLGLGGKRHVAVDFSVGELFDRLCRPGGDKLKILAWVEADIGCDGGEEDVATRAKLGYRDAFPFEVAHGTNPPVADKLKASDVQASKHDSRISRVHPQDMPCGESHGNVNFARGEHFFSLFPAS